MRSIAENRLIVPSGVQRRAGIKGGDRLKFVASPGMITITAVDKVTYKATRAELLAIQKGEAEIANGKYVDLADLLHGLESHRRRRSEKRSRKVSR